MAFFSAAYRRNPNVANEGTIAYCMFKKISQKACDMIFSARCSSIICANLHGPGKPSLSGHAGDHTKNRIALRGLDQIELIFDHPVHSFKSNIFLPIGEAKRNRDSGASDGGHWNDVKFVAARGDGGARVAAAEGRGGGGVGGGRGRGRRRR